MALPIGFFPAVHVSTRLHFAQRLRPPLMLGMALFGLVLSGSPARSQKTENKGHKASAPVPKTQPPSSTKSGSKSPAPHTPAPNQNAVPPSRQSPAPVSKTPGSPNLPAPAAPQSKIENQKSKIAVSLLAPLSTEIQAQAAHVEIDGNILSGPLPVFWRGNARTPPFRPAGEETRGNNNADNGGDAATSPSGLSVASLSALRKNVGAGLTRLYPFATPGTLTLHPDGTPIVRWESVDAALKQAGQAGEEIVFTLQGVSNMTADGWRALTEATLRRYRNNPPAPIVRWEAALSAAEAPARYEPFARLARSLAPDTPIGLNLVSGDVGEGFRRMAQVCAQNRVPLDSVAWRLADTPDAAAQQIERVRRALAPFPGLKNVFLLPTLAVPGGLASSSQAFFNPASPASPVPARLLSYAARLLETAPLAPPNALVGALLEEPLPALAEHARDSNVALQTSEGHAPADVEAAQCALALLNRMAGTRLQSRSDDGSIACLSARSQNRVFVLLWRESARNLAYLRPAARAPAERAALINVRLQHPGWQGGAGLRVRQYDLAQALAASQSNNAPNTPAEFSLLPTGVANAVWNGSTAPDVVETPVLLPPGGACLLEIAPLPAKPVMEMTLSTTSSHLYGGDPISVILSVHNLTARAQELNLTLSSPFRDLPAGGSAQFKPGVLPPNGSRAFRFALPAPVLRSDTNVTLNARDGTSAAALTFPVQMPLEAALESPRTDVESGTGRANVRVRLRNRSAMPLSVHLQAGEKTGTTLTVPPGDKPVIAVLAAAPASREPGLYATFVHVESSGRRLQTLPSLIGVPFLCPYATTKPALNGDLKAWSGNTPFGLGRAEQVRGKAWGGPGDISGVAYAQWDEKYFYFACAVTDDVFTPATSAATLERGDCIFFALAGGGNGKTPYAKFGMGLVQTGTSASTSVLLRYTPASNGSGKAKPVPMQNARFAIRREDTRTFYEAAIPWNELLPASTAPPSLVSLAIQLHDVDGKTQGDMEWGSGLNGTITPPLFLPLRLVKPTAR